ncbi:Mur ligase family protein [Piscinibacter sp.]|jgi:UDP-N-acetylmuramoyl-L-alanyl-D-glutamate--2,6-diaminopimelate ligase|uniref:Mur ligase family protein n=1 Tax=Piscinibacter sp. TaxID=1903157 RepID=UPI002F4037C7
MAQCLLSSLAQALDWLASRGVRALATDSRRVKPGDAFIAWPGYAQDGRRYVAAALAAGAVACLVEADGAEAFGFGSDERIATMHGLKTVTGPLASAFLGAPSERLKVVAATGTNGKTSSAWWTAQALSALGQRCAVVGTLGIGEPPSVRPELVEGPGGTPPGLRQAQPEREAFIPIAFTGLTTPDPVMLQTAFKRFADEGFAACALEASSIGIVEHRLSGSHIDVALYTNFTRDHLDYHGSMTTYWHAKSQLFHWRGLKSAVVNLDDEQGAALARHLAPGSLDVWTYSTKVDARLRAQDIAYTDGGLGFELNEGAARASVRTALIGDYNVSNLLAVIGGLRALGVPLADAASVCSELTPVPGRMQRVAFDGNGPELVVDYAHTPDALEKALLALQPLAQARGGALWCVFGCGGNRDTTKRPLMGEIAQRLAQHVVVTSDNPRDEPPARILAQIVAGMTEANAPLVIEDRRAAIAHAVARCDARDVILVAGKGHEDYQEIAGVKQPFSDVVEAQAALARRSAA